MNNSRTVLHSCIVIYISLFHLLQRASPSTRIIQSTTNLSKFVHHFWEPQDAIESSTAAVICITESISNNTQRNTRDIKLKVKNFNTSQSTASTTVSNEVDLSILTEEFKECEKIGIELGCYIKFDNGSVRIPAYKKTYSEGNYFINEHGELFVCSKIIDSYIDDSKFSKVLDIVSIVGVAISLFCISLHMIMFLLLKKLRNLPGYCLFSLCISLAIAYICSFIPLGIPEDSECSAVGMIMFYAFLASFFWMNVMSYDVWRSLRMATSKLRLTRDKPMFMRFALYSCYSWGSPILIIIISLIVDNVYTDFRYNLIFNKQTCWFAYKQALLIYFALPVFVLLILNVIFFISSFIMINSATMNTSENRAALWSRFLVSLRLAIVMGLVWVCSILATATQATALWYIYSILTTFQGVFIFFCFSFTEKTMKECKRLVTKKKSSIFPTQTSTSRSQPSTVQQESAF